MKDFILFYDGPCILCNYWILKLCKWDKNDRLRFTSLESNYAANFFKKHPSKLLNKDSIISWDSKKGYKAEAEAVFHVLKQLNGLWSLLLIFSLLPKFLTNSLYRIIAQNRYHWFGKYDHCPLPKKKYAHKFL